MLIIDVLLILRGKKSMIIHLRILSLTLQDNKKYVKFSPRRFCRRQITFLGHVATTEGVLVDPREAKIICKWKQPMTITKICGFLGLIGCYQHFIKGISKLALLLTRAK